MRHLEGAFYRYVESVSKGSPFKTGLWIGNNTN